MTSDTTTPTTFRGPVGSPVVGDCVFADGADQTLLWYVPALALREPDPAFGFTVTQSADAAGAVFNEATLALTADVVAPPELGQARQQFPTASFSPIEFTTSKPHLVIPFTDAAGHGQSVAVEGTATATGSSIGFQFVLTGPQTVQSYLSLTELGGSAVELPLDYRLDVRSGGADPCAALQSEVATLLADVNDPDLPRLIKQNIQKELAAAQGRLLRCRTAALPRQGEKVAAADMALAYAASRYASRFTVTTGSMTRSIIDVHDLTEFASARSEYRELLTLGDVHARYPSIRRLYLGQVSGTVVAVPASYGIACGASGAAARCDAVVDDSPVSITGCRFHFTFTVAPGVDPVDLASLSADLATVPEAANRNLTVRLPAGLDPRHTATLDGFPGATAAFADGTDPHTIRIAVDIADDQATPGITKANLFLAQLAATGSAPLFANVAVRLDDTFPQQVETVATLNLYQTANTDDVTAAITGLPPAAQVVNTGSLDLTLHRYALCGADRPAVTPLAHQLLPAGTSATLTTATGQATSVAVSSSLAVPAPMPKAAIFDYIRFHTETVQQVQHPLTVNAAGLDFTAAAVTSIGVHFTVAGVPHLAVPDLTLSPSHTIDFVHVLVAVDAAVTGLDTTVTLTADTAAGQRVITLDHDFIDEPTLIITRI